MIPSPSREVSIAEDARFVFPASPCCNCGAAEAQVIPQDTRLTRFWGFGGSECQFTLPLPFCSRCVPTSKRRPPTWIKRVLVFGISWIAALVALIPIALAAGEHSWLAEWAPLVAVVVGAAATIAWYLTRSPRLEQSSYYQPVRIVKLRQEFFSERVRGITFAFTNPTYASAFEGANAEAIQRGAVKVKRIGSAALDQRHAG